MPTSINNRIQLDWNNPHFLTSGRFPATDKHKYFEISYFSYVLLPQLNTPKIFILGGIRWLLYLHLPCVRWGSSTRFESLEMNVASFKRKLKTQNCFGFFLFFLCDLKANTCIQTCYLSSLNCLSEAPGSLFEHREEPCILKHQVSPLSGGRCILESWTWVEMILKKEKKNCFSCLTHSHTHTSTGAFVVALYINAGDTQGLTSVQIFDLVFSPLSASIMCL